MLIISLLNIYGYKLQNVAIGMEDAVYKCQKTGGKNEIIFMISVTRIPIDI